MSTVRLSWLRPLALVSLLLVSVSAHAVTPWGRGESQGEDLRIFLVTFGPGDETFSMFGHTALGVEDTKRNVSRLYNYGMFRFDETMVARFVMGRLWFWVDEAPVGGTFRLYIRENRDVRVQELNLTPPQRLEVADFLSNNVKPENRNYLYHHYNDNCSTRPRDVINRALDGAYEKTMSTPARLSLRDHTRRFAFVDPIVSEGMDFGMANPVDRPMRRYDEAFLPLELEAQLDELQVQDPVTGTPVPLVMRKWTVNEAKDRPPVPFAPPSYKLPLAVFGVLLGGLALLWARKDAATSSRPRRWALGVQTSLLGLVFGILGCVLVFFWTVSDHTITYRNQNLLLASPLLLAAFPLGIAWGMGKGWALKGLRFVWTAQAVAAVIGLLLKALPGVRQDNWEMLALFLPLNLGHAWAFLLPAWPFRLLSRSGGTPKERDHGTGSVAPNH